MNAYERAFYILLGFMIIALFSFTGQAEAQITEEDFVKYKTMFTDRDMVIGYGNGVYNYDQFCEMYYAQHPDERMRIGYWVEIGKSTTTSRAATEILDEWHEGYEREDLEHVPGQPTWYIYRPGPDAKDKGWRPDVPGYRPVPVYNGRPGTYPAWYVYYPTYNPDAQDED